MVALAELSSVIVQKPITGAKQAKARYDGSSPATISATPKPVAAKMSSRSRIVGRRAASSAPASEPTASAEPRMPNSPAPLSKTWVAMSAEVIWKFIPKVPAKKTSTRIIIIFGWERT